MFNQWLSLVPCGYLIASRYPGVVPVIGYVWLELLPVTVALVCLVGWQGMLYPVMQIPFIGLYEVGYLINDSAKNASERADRFPLALSPFFVTMFVGFRFLVFALLVCWLVDELLQDAAVLYAMSSILIFALLLLHTWVGSLRSWVRKLRLLTFAALAYIKYLPAILLFLMPVNALLLLLPVFFAYGSGRTVDYGLIKFSGRPEEKWHGFKWFICTLPLLGLLYLSGLYGSEVIALALAFGSYYLVSVVRTHFMGEWHDGAAG